MSVVGSDFDNDGDNDLAVANWYTNNVIVLKNLTNIPAHRCCIGLRGNVDNDLSNTIDVGDIVYLVDYSFSNGPAPICVQEADVDGSGAVAIVQI